ncbi:MAG: hypothetical protein ACHRHE_01375 [Tepidisphaerales bacterium]
MAEPAIIVCQVDTPEGVKNYVTCLSHEHAFAKGLAPQAIIGVLSRSLEPGEAITPALFARNRVFVDFMHEVIARRAPELPGLIAEARRQGKGLICVIDQRTRTPHGAVPPEDIIGVFVVKSGQVASDSYHPNPNHVILTADGFFQLGSELQPCLLEELSRIG